MLSFILINLKSIGAFFALIFGITLLKKNQSLKEELKNKDKIITIQKKIADAKENDKVISGNDVIKLMLDDKE